MSKCVTIVNLKSSLGLITFIIWWLKNSEFNECEKCGYKYISHEKLNLKYFFNSLCIIKNLITNVLLKINNYVNLKAYDILHKIILCIVSKYAC